METNESSQGWRERCTSWDKSHTVANLLTHPPPPLPKRLLRKVQFICFLATSLRQRAPPFPPFTVGGASLRLFRSSLNFYYYREPITFIIVRSNAIKGGKTVVLVRRCSCKTTHKTERHTLLQSFPLSGWFYSEFLKSKMVFP